MSSQSVNVESQPIVELVGHRYNLGIFKRESKKLPNIMGNEAPVMAERAQRNLFLDKMARGKLIDISYDEWLKRKDL